MVVTGPVGNLYTQFTTKGIGSQECYTLCIFNRRSGIKNGLKHGRGSLSIISPPPSRFSASQPGNLLVFLLTLLNLLGSGGEAASGPGLGGAAAGLWMTEIHGLVLIDYESSST